MDCTYITFDPDHELIKLAAQREHTAPSEASQLVCEGGPVNKNDEDYEDMDARAGEYSVRFPNNMGANRVHRL
jgi:hypothetical protein